MYPEQSEKIRKTFLLPKKKALYFFLYIPVFKILLGFFFHLAPE